VTPLEAALDYLRRGELGEGDDLEPRARRAATAISVGQRKLRSLADQVDNPEIARQLKELGGAPPTTD